MPKSSRKKKKMRHDPLGKQLTADPGQFRKEEHKRVKQRKAKQQDEVSAQCPPTWNFV